jgi:hypothetical protein
VGRVEFTFFPVDKFALLPVVPRALPLLVLVILLPAVACFFPYTEARVVGFFEDEEEGKGDKELDDDNDDDDDDICITSNFSLGTIDIFGAVFNDAEGSVAVVGVDAATATGGGGGGMTSVAGGFGIVLVVIVIAFPILGGGVGKGNGDGGGGAADILFARAVTRPMMLVFALLTSSFLFQLKLKMNMFITLHIFVKMLVSNKPLIHSMNFPVITFLFNEVIGSVGSFPKLISISSLILSSAFTPTFFR